MAFPRSFPCLSWPRHGSLLTSVKGYKKEVTVKWMFDRYYFLHQGKNASSKCFKFTDTIWHLFASFDKTTRHSLFGVNVEKDTSLDVILDCTCEIYFNRPNGLIKHIQYNFECKNANSHSTVEKIFSDSEFNEFLDQGSRIQCIIKVLKLKPHAQTKLLEKAEEELSRTSKVCKDFKNLLLSGDFSDVTLQVQDQQFKAHISILAARSSVFASMFQHDMKEKATRVVDIQDCEPSAFRVLLEFIYCGSAENISVENMFSLYAYANKYDIEDLKMKCLQFIKVNLSVDTFCKTLHLSLQHSEPNLLKLATEFFISNCQQITLTAEWLTFLSENPIPANELFTKASKHMSPIPQKSSSNCNWQNGTGSFNGAEWN